LISGRYRIVSILGKGGMGEVYRADDLTLGQSVALKFLPMSLSGDSDAVSRFRNEVRVARLVSHPNVCRVHDLGEVQGPVFLSMEYIDGEDLPRLCCSGSAPAANDKAVEIARKLCAGLRPRTKGIPTPGPETGQRDARCAWPGAADGFLACRVAEARRRSQRHSRPICRPSNWWQGS
jgi:serine/threonine protein kinase